jgi:uncharacterized protein
METRAPFPITPLTKVSRLPARASYDGAVAYAILDEALVAAVGFVDGEQPFVIPMAYARHGDALVLHAASASRFQRVLASGVRLCVTITLVDGIVLARSAFHHSMNYRSVVVLGSPTELTNEPDKLAALASLVDHALPGRSTACRPPSAIELKATRVFALPLVEVSVKRRTGGPLDDAEDLESSCWAGVIPFAPRAGTPEPDAAHPPRGPEPSGLAIYDRATFTRDR